MRKTALVLLAAALAGCTGVEPPEDAARSRLEARIAAALAQRGLGLDALSVIDNVVRHEGPPPPAAPPLVRELLADPLRAIDGRRPLPPPRAVRARPVRRAPEGAPPRPFDEILAAYIEELAAAQRELRAATGKVRLDEAAIVRGLAQGQLPVDSLVAMAAATDTAGLQHANHRFLDATARFVAALRVAPDLPRAARRFDSPIGIVSIGSPAPTVTVRTPR